jgi:hypothetical protein
MNVSSPFLNLEKIVKKSKKKYRSNKKPELKTRDCKCLGHDCGKIFKSTYAFGLCDSCKKGEAYRNVIYDIEYSVCYN